LLLPCRTPSSIVAMGGPWATGHYRLRRECKCPRPWRTVPGPAYVSTPVRAIQVFLTRCAASTPGQDEVGDSDRVRAGAGCCLFQSAASASARPGCWWTPLRLPPDRERSHAPHRRSDQPEARFRPRLRPRAGRGASVGDHDAGQDPGIRIESPPAHPSTADLAGRVIERWPFAVAEPDVPTENTLEQGGRLPDIESGDLQVTILSRSAEWGAETAWSSSPS
jgi:hypothetical protein